MWHVWGRGKFCVETHEHGNEPSDSVKYDEFLH